MNKLLLCLFGITLLYACEGARRINLDGRLRAWREKRMLQRSLGEDKTRRNNEFPEDLLDLGKDEKLTAKDAVLKKSGHRQVKLQETYKGLPITGETVVLELDENGEYTGVYGRLVEGLEDDIPSVEPQLTKQNVINIAVADQSDNLEDTYLEPEKDVTLEVYLEKLGDELKATLVYRVAYLVENPHKLSRPVYIINANEGTIVDNWNDIDTMPFRRQEEYEFVRGAGGNDKSGKFLYDGHGKYPLLKVKKTADGRCKLENEHVRVVHVNFTYDRTKNDTHEFDCLEGNLDKINGAYSPLNDVYFYSNVVHDMFMEWFGRPPLEGGIVARVHYGDNMKNAFYNGATKTVNFGDGNMEDVKSKWHPLTTLDVIAHEIGHGVTREFSNLVYKHQSGSINEAFSDMTGVAADYYLQYTNWEVGSKVLTCGSLRYMYDPQLDKKSVGHANKFCPFMNVHYSSGIFNKAFYLLSHTNGWNIRSAFEVFYMANRLYWHEDSGFGDAACGVVKATKDAEKSVDDVIGVFNKVGVEPCVFDSSFDLRGGVNQTFRFSVNFTKPTAVVAFPERQQGNTAIWLSVLNVIGNVVQEEDYTWNYEELKLNTVQDYFFATEVQIGPYFEEDRIKHWSLLSYPLDDVRVVGTNISLAEEGKRDSGNYSYMSFDVPEELFDDQPEDVRMLVIIEEVEGNAGSYYLNYDEPADLSNWRYEYRSTTHGAGENEFSIIFVCSPRPGTYYLTAYEREDAGRVNIHYMPATFL